MQSSYRLFPSFSVLLSNNSVLYLWKYILVISSFTMKSIKLELTFDLGTVRERQPYYFAFCWSVNYNKENINRINVSQSTYLENYFLQTIKAKLLSLFQIYIFNILVISIFLILMKLFNFFLSTIATKN